MRSKAYILQNFCIIDSMKLYNQGFPFLYNTFYQGGGQNFARGRRAPRPQLWLRLCLEHTAKWFNYEWHDNFKEFKKKLYSYYKTALHKCYDVDDPRTWKSVCIKCNQARDLTIDR
jgi:hypothetical protein